MSSTAPTESNRRPRRSVSLAQAVVAVAATLACVASSISPVTALTPQAFRALLQAPSGAAPSSIDIDGNSVEVVSCEVGVRDCEATDPFPTETCAPYNGYYTVPEDLTWVIGVSAAVACIMAFGIGANDAANSWGTTVGSGAMPLRAALILGGTMEWLGAVSLGYGVAKTVTKGTAKVTSPSCFACGYCDSHMTVFMIGMMSALFAAAIFLFLATFTSMPVSTTHAIIGAVVGSTISGVGFQCLNWSFDGGLGGIMASWVISPVASGCFALLMYYLTYYFVLEPCSLARRMGLTDPRRNALIAQPVLYTLQSFVIVFLILLKSAPTKKWATSKQALIALGIAAGVLLVSVCLWLPYLRRVLPSVVRERKMEGGGIEEDADPHASVSALVDTTCWGRVCRGTNSVVAYLLLSNEPFVDFHKIKTACCPWWCCAFGCGGAAMRRRRARKARGEPESSDDDVSTSDTERKKSVTFADATMTPTTCDAASLPPISTPSRFKTQGDAVDSDSDGSPRSPLADRGVRSESSESDESGISALEAPAQVVATPASPEPLGMADYGASGIAKASAQETVANAAAAAATTDEPAIREVDASSFAASASEVSGAAQRQANGEAELSAENARALASLANPFDVASNRRAQADAIGGITRTMTTRPRSDSSSDAYWTFRFLLVFTAAFESFAHGANDTGNATGAFTGVLEVYESGLDSCDKGETPVWVMVVAGAFVFAGVTLLGYRVIRTIGSNLVDINFQRGYCVEFGSTLSVVIATILNMPVSTTHAQVGAIVFVGVGAFGWRNVAWGLFARIVGTWVLTLPLAALISGGLTAAFRTAIIA